jgi:hypothetical protein
MDWEINDVLARTLVIFGQHKEALRVAKQANEIGKIEERRVEKKGYRRKDIEEHSRVRADATAGQKGEEKER